MLFQNFHIISHYLTYLKNGIVKHHFLIFKMLDLCLLQQKKIVLHMLLYSTTFRSENSISFRCFDKH